MTEPNEHTTLNKPTAQSKLIEKQWYVDITVPHPTDPELPPQLASIPVPTEWWSDFLVEAIEDHNVEWWNFFKEDPKEF